MPDLPADEPQQPASVPPRPPRAPTTAADAAPYRRQPVQEGKTRKGSKPTSLEDRMTVLGIVGGGLMILGFLFPFLVPRYSSIRDTWFWDVLDDASSRQVIRIILPLVTGILGVVFSMSMRGRKRGIALVATVGGMLVLALSLMRRQEYGPFALPLGSSIHHGLSFGLMMMTALICSFVGIGVTRRAPQSRVGPTMQGASGAVMLVLCVIPIGGDFENAAPLGLLFNDQAWEVIAPILVVVLLFLAYAALCLAAFARRDDPEPFLKGCRVAGWSCVCAFPALWFLNILIESRWDFGPTLAFALSLLLKTFGSLYGYLLLLGLGLTAWIASSIPTAASDSRQQLAAPAFAADTLRERLEALDGLRRDGIVTEEEYQQKRAQVIDRWDM